ncbi:MAG: ROK family protein [Candidatus Omnitrophica bacterium]|nr:ROK family protein [Candidatus Omnitrophota bacterium]
MSENTGWTIGIDIGGTFVKYGLVKGGRVAGERSFSTSRFSSPRQLQDRLVLAARELIGGHRGVAGVGIGIPGLVKYPEGIVKTCVNIPGWKNVPLRRLLQKRLHVPVQVENDVNVMTLAEWRYGAGRGADDLLCMTLGTGVGGGLVLNGRFYRGWGGTAGEVGHMPLQMDGIRCACGGRGCLERYVGNREIIAWVRQQIRQGRQSILIRLTGGRPSGITPEIIDAACAKGDRLARETWERVGTHIGTTLAGVVNLLSPEKIVIGGGISKAGKWLFEPIRRTVRERVMRGVQPVSIVPALLGGSAGIIGAGLLIREWLDSQRNA